MTEMSLRDGLRETAMRLWVDASYTSRGHLEETKRWIRWSRWFGVPLAGVSALAASGAALSAIFGKEVWLTAGLALLSAVLTGVRGFLRPDELATAHGVKGNRYIGIRNDALFFLQVDLRSSATDTELVARLREIEKNYNDFTVNAPHVIEEKQYAAAQRGIQAGEAGYRNDPLWKELEKEL
jgi:hypothetical protein